MNRFISSLSNGFDKLLLSAQVICANIKVCCKETTCRTARLAAIGHVAQFDVPPSVSVLGRGHSFAGVRQD